MPLPVPKSDESKNDFLARCMGSAIMIDEFSENSQRYAVCLDQYNTNKKNTLAQKINARFPGNLESQYQKMMGRFVDQLNKEYFKILRQILADEFRTNTRDYRVNVNYQSIQKRLRDIKKSLPRKKIYKNIFESMQSVFNNIKNEVTKNIKKQYKRKKFPVPELELNADSQALKTAIERNVELIQAIEEKQSDLLENSVLEAVRGGSNFDKVFDEVQAQANRGRAYSEFVARDQVGKAYAKINEEKQKSVGFPGYIWQATNDDRTRDSHAALDQQYFSWDKPPEIEPGRFLHPGEDYQCRCIAIPSFAPE